MSPWLRVRISWWLASAALAVGCGGEVIRLGDGPPEVATGAANATGGAVSGSGGAAGGGLLAGGMAGEATLGGAGGDAGSGGAGACASGTVLASEVVWIGDSWVIRPGTQHTRVTELARQAGTLGPTEDYAFDLAKEAEDMAAVAKQYERGQARTPIKVLLMDGGTWDPIIANLAGASVSAAIDTSLTNFRALLAKIASDGTVENIVYFLVPALPTIPGVDVMRPQLKQACDESVVPCYFVDLQPLWDQRKPDEPSYTADDGIQASPTGGTVIGEAIWKTMQDHCIAQ
jgi:hypothetical protein